MASPGSFASQVPPGEDNTVRKIADLGRDVRELGPSIAASFKPVIEDLQAKQAALEDLVSKQIDVATGFDWQQNFDITSATTVHASASFIVPAGFTRALVAAVGTGMGYNNSGASAWLYVAPTLTGAAGGAEVYTGVAAAGGTSLASPYFTLLEGLTDGETITVGTQMRVSGADWTANTGNVARVDAQVTYLR